MAAERVDLFYEEASKHSGNVAKSTSECLRLCKWLQKHQNEIVPAAQQNRLIQLVDLHKKQSSPEAMLELVQTYLALPEGKLTTAKGKQKCLKLLDELSPSSATSSSSSSSVASSSPTRYLVIDIDVDKNLLTLALLTNPDEIVENASCCDPSLLAAIKDKFASSQEGGDVDEEDVVVFYNARDGVFAFSA